jgi:hypothetical protein
MGLPLFGLHSTIVAIGDSAQPRLHAHLVQFTDLVFCIVSLAAILIRCAGAVRETVET